VATVLITGASSGFGYEATCRLGRHGHRVFATMRGVNDRNVAARESLERIAATESLAIEVVELDVTDEASVNGAVDVALAAAGHLDVVINNAGVSSIGLTEAYTPEQFQQIFDINLYGPVRVNRAVLPSMRQRRSGLLIHVSSGAGRLTVPALAPYCASKFALEALADAYQYELRPSGVQSVLVEPGIYRTAIFDRVVTPDDHERVLSYGPSVGYVDRVHGVFLGAVADPDNPGATEVADALVRLVEMAPHERPFRTVVSPPIEQLLQPYNDMAEALRPVVAGIFGVPELAAPIERE
jgi:NAD(P)-dependent dehydrogenase (short-subunit alcohol dehydrogenase family)